MSRQHSCAKRNGIIAPCNYDRKPVSRKQFYQYFSKKFPCPAWQQKSKEKLNQILSTESLKAIDHIGQYHLPKKIQPVPFGGAKIIMDCLWKTCQSENLTLPQQEHMSKSASMIHCTPNANLL